MAKNKVGVIPATKEICEVIIEDDDKQDTGDEVKVVKPSVVNPESLVFKLWEAAIYTTSVLSILFVTSQIAFRAESLEFSVLIYVFDLLYIFHIGLRFYVPYTSEGAFVCDKRKIKRKYLRTSFAVDLISVIPIELISLAIRYTIVDWEYAVRIERINRIFRFYSVLVYLERQEVKLGIKAKIIRSFKYALGAFMIIHILSCGWFMLACPNSSHNDHTGHGSHAHCYQTSWASKLGENFETSNLLQKYITCFYWATITSTSTGYGDISAITTPEKWWSILSMLCGIGFFFGPILGYMASTITNADAQRAKYSHRVQVIKDHLKNVSVTPETQKKVHGFYDHLWHRHHGIIKDNMFHDLPITFQSEISLAVNKHVLEKSPLFKDISVEFLRTVSMVIKQATYLPKQVIVNEDEIRHTLFYITKGTAEVLTGSSSCPLKVLNEGSFFGEVALMMNMPRAATVRASAYCEMLILERTDLIKVMNHFPTVGRQLQSVITQRCKNAAYHLEKKNKVSHFGATQTEIFIEEDQAISFSDYKDDSASTRNTRSDSINIVRNKYIYAPSCNYCKYWNLIFAIVLVVFSFVHTIVAAYYTSFGQTGYGPWFGLLYFVDLFYVFDIIVCLRTAVKDETESLIDDPKRIFKHYLRSKRIWLDVVSILPFELFCLAIPNAKLRWVVITMVRSNRLLKFGQIFVHLKELEDDIEIDIRKVRTVKLALLIFSVCHACACIWFLQACFGDSCTPESWAVQNGFNKTTPVHEMYITSLYWSAVTMTSTGYGDIHAYTTMEEVIAILMFLIGLLLFGYSLSNIAAILTNILYPKVQFMGRINGVVDYMKEQKLTPALISRVEEYLGLVWRTHRGEAIPGSQLLMGDMPNRLQLEVSFEEMHSVLSQVPIFRNTAESFIRLLASKLIMYVFSPGDMIVYRGDVGREMYIIRRGLVEVLNQDQCSVVATLGPGGFFGEVGLIFGESRTADVRTKTYCEIAMLRKSDLDEVLQSFPLILHQFKTTSINDNILQEIKKAAFTAEEQVTPRKKKRIELIETTKERRSKSVFQWKNVPNQLSSEEAAIEVELKAEHRRPYEELSRLQYVLSYLLMRRVIHPNGKFFHFWTVFSCVMSYVCQITTGLQVAFILDDNYVFAINYVIDFFFLADIYLKLHVGFYNNDGILITHPTATARNYLKTAFISDFIAFIPLDLFAMPYKAIFVYLKLNRLFHILRVGQYFSFLEEPITSSPYYQAIKFATYIYLMIHVFACAWFKVGCPEQSHCILGSWALQENRNVSQDAAFRQYVMSMYWASATACSVGYGDIHAYTVPEKIVSIFCTIFGIVFFGYIIATLTASLANADAQRARFKSKLDSVNRFLLEQRVESGLAKRVRDFYQFLWNRNKGVNLETLFEGLPTSLQADITLSLYKDIIESVPLFQGTELGFTKMLSLYIKPLLLPKGEYIVKKGDIGEEMFFIHKGIVEVVSEHETPIVFDTMEPGRFFGEISTIFSCPRTASVRAQTNTDLFVLTKKDLDVVLGHYPNIRKQIMETAEERQRMVQERAKAAAAKKAEEERQRAATVIAAMRRYSIAAVEAARKQSAVTVIEETGECVPTELLDAAQMAKIVIPKETCGEKVKKVWDACASRIARVTNFTIAHDSRLNWWMDMNSFLIVLHIITTTYMATFQDFQTGFFIFNVLVEISLYLEMIMKSQMSYLSVTGDVVTDIKEIRKHYLKGDFKFDAVVNFPLWIFSFAADVAWRFWYPYFSLLQLLRIKRIFDYFKRSMGKLDANILLIRISDNATKILIQLQISACLWYIIACQGEKCVEDSWISKQLASTPNTNLTSFQKYTDSMYWAFATMTSTGYGDITATTTNEVEMIFASLIMVLGKISFGFVLGNVASSLANMETLRVLFEERFHAIISHMHELDIPMSLRQRVINFFQYMWRRNKGSSIEGVFNILPSCLNAELCINLTGEAMKDVPFFNGCEWPFIRQLCMRSNLIQFHETEYIFRQGEIGSEMYIIKRGNVEVSGPLGTEILGPNEFFGDESLIKHAPRPYSARALTNVDVFYVRDVDLQNTFRSFPEEALRVQDNVGDMDRRGSYMHEDFYH